MYSVLIQAVLSTSSNYDPLFESICWHESSIPEPERIEALTALIEGFGPLFDRSAVSEETGLPADKRRYVVDKIESIIWTHCLPLLSKISEGAGDTKSRERTAVSCRLLGVCASLCEPAVTARLVLSVLPSLQRSDEEQSSSGRLCVEVATEVIAVLLPSISSNEELTKTTLSAALSCVKAQSSVLASKITLRILMTLLTCRSDGRTSRTLKLIVEDLCCWHCSQCTPSVTERTLLCLTALSDQLFSLQHDLDLPSQYWRIIQTGLTHHENTSRKRALFLLKRCVVHLEEKGVDYTPASSEDDTILFKWTTNKSKLLKSFWEDYVLVMETLEENQVHVVRPILNRIDTLIQTTADNMEGQNHFHPSWLLCVYQRMFHSENKSLMREGVCHMLELQVLQQADFACVFSQFIVGPFMDVLSETSLYYRVVGQSIGECPELAAKLQVFLSTFFSGLHQKHRAHVLLQLIQRLGSKHWCAVPLFFLSQALSKLPPNQILDSVGLTALREVLRCTMITHQVLLRGAAQCFLLSSALNLTQVSAVTLEDFFSFLMHFRADESLCRGTPLWYQLCAWLLKNEHRFKPSIMDEQLSAPYGVCQPGSSTGKETIRGYVQSKVHKYLQIPPSTGQAERLPDAREADKTARAILLCVDIENSTSSDQCSSKLLSLLSPLMDTLSKVDSNVYLPLRKSDKGLQLMLRLLQLEGIQMEDKEDTVMAVIKKQILGIAESVQGFILRRLCGELQDLFDIERAELYLCVLKQLAVMHLSVPEHRYTLQYTYFPKLVSCSLKILQDPNQQGSSMAKQVTRVIAMASLATVCRLVKQQVIDAQSETVSALMSLNVHFYNAVLYTAQTQASLEHFNHTPQRPQTLDCSSDARAQGSVLQDWGRIAAQYMRDQWVCLSSLMSIIGLPECVKPFEAPNILKAALTSAVEALALLPSDLVLPVFTFMETVLPQVVHHYESLCVEVVMRTWELVQGLSTNAHDFWPALKGFVSMAFQHDLLELTDSQTPTLVATMKQVATELMELSQSKTGVFSVLIHHCCLTWLPNDLSHHADIVLPGALNYINILAEACVYGPVFRRDQRLIQDVQTYVEHLGDACAANMALKSDNRDDQFPRTCALSFLSRLDSTNPLHQKIMESLVINFLNKDSSISKSKTRYYSNSMQHRVKNRIWQTLLLLLPKLREEFVTSSLDRIFAAGFSSNQASVKYLIEWMIILVLVQYPQHIDNFWSCFSTSQEKTKTSICTYLSVLVHFNVIIPKLKDKTAQWHKALDITLQWCFNHNFSVRLYALLALKRLWALADAELGASNLGGLATIIEACLDQAETMQSTGNANKNWMRIQEHFIFGTFHPIRDYSVETIFHTFPRLSALADDEWIPLWKFDKLSLFSKNTSCPLRNPVADLSLLEPGDWIQQDKTEQDKEERWAEVQKKIIPWRLGVQEQELELGLVTQERAARLGKLHGALVVVASLIDKPTNLGGLCRTCEIFGASSLVLDSLHHVSDKHFQSLSVSSELWLPLLEVKVGELASFLQRQKSDGYCIVGVEQTANSQSLQDYRFPTKTLLLLGNEREGIPANLLQLLDVCVEIPQQGIIRSLNVHVSAALLIWEYTRQQLIQADVKHDLHQQP